MSLPPGWMSCTVIDDNGAHVIIEPDCWAGLLMADHVDEPRCQARAGVGWKSYVICGLPVGHECDHLACAPELIAGSGTLKPVSWVDEVTG